MKTKSERKENMEQNCIKGGNKKLWKKPQTHKTESQKQKIKSQKKKLYSIQYNFIL